MHIQLAPKHHVVIHCFGRNLGNLALRELQEGVATRPCCLDGARDAQFCDLAKLLEEVLQFCLIEALWQVADIDNAATVPSTHLQLVEPA